MYKGHVSTPMGEEYERQFWENRKNYPVNPALIMVGAVKDQEYGLEIDGTIDKQED